MVATSRYTLQNSSHNTFLLKTLLFFEIPVRYNSVTCVNIDIAPVLFSNDYYNFAELNQITRLHISNVLNSDMGKLDCEVFQLTLAISSLMHKT